MEGNQQNLPKNPVYPGRPLAWSGPPENRVLTQPNQPVSKLLANARRVVILVIILQLGWLGLRTYQYFSGQKEIKRLVQEKLQEQEKQAQIYLQEIPEPNISQGFLDYYATEGGAAR